MPVLDTARYTNQYYDVRDLPQTTVDERGRTCNVSCLSMIVDEDVNDVLAWFINKYGWNDQFQVEENLIAYLRSKAFQCEPLIPAAWPDSRFPTKGDLAAMRKAVDDGLVVLYHKLSHYQIMTGYIDNGNGNYDYVFNDPAGDRKLPIASRERESGHSVVYPASMVQAEKIYGRCWSVG